MPVPTQMRMSTIHSAMNERRQRGEHVTLRQYIGEKFPDYYSQNRELQLERYYQDMGINYNSVTVGQMIDAAEGNYDMRDLFAETMLPAIYDGIANDESHRQFVASSHANNEAVITQPYIKYDHTAHRKSIGKDKAIPPGGAFKKNKLEMETKMGTPEKFGDEIEIKYETIADCRVAVLNDFLTSYLAICNLEKADYIVDTIINGDRATDIRTKEIVDSSAAVIGVADTAQGITYDDVDRGTFHMCSIKRPADLISGRSDTLRQIKNLPEMKIPYDGSPIFSFKIDGHDQLPRTGYLNYVQNEGQILLLNQKSGVAEHIKQALMIEKERLVSKQVVFVVFSERISYMNLIRAGKCVIDGTLSFSSNGFPTYMERPTRK